MNYTEYHAKGMFMVMAGLARLHNENQKEIDDLEQAIKELDEKEPLIPKHVIPKHE